jgi:PAS domain S-box-containing protein
MKAKPAALRDRAEARLRKKPSSKTAAEPQRVLHELQVHQVELEMQNAELQETRDRLEALLEQYTDLYDFAPVGYFTLTAEGVINRVNLTGSQLVGIERSKLVGRAFGPLLATGERPAFKDFLQQVFASQTKQSGEFALLHRTVSIEAQRSPNGRECRAMIKDITNRKLVENAVRVSEIRYRRLFEAAHDGVLILDPITRKITDANPFMTQLLGYPHDQLVGKELFEIGLLEDEAASQEMFRKLKRQHEVRYEDLPLESKSGRHQEVEVVANLYQENGHAVIQCNIRDITERKLAEQNLRLTSTAMEAAANGIFITNREGIMQYVNPAFTAMSGFAASEAIGQKASLVKSDAHEEAFYQNLWQTIISGRVWNGQITNRNKSGQLYVCEQNISPVRNASGVISHFVSVQRDITDRMRAEEVLRRSQALFTALIDQSPLGIYVVDSQFRLQQVNARALPIFKDIQPLIGRDFSEIHHLLWSKRISDPIIKRFRHTLKTGEAYQAPEFKEQRRDIGEMQIYEWQIQRVTLPAGEYGLVCFFNDITERKKAEWVRRRLDVLTASNRKLEEEIVHRQAVEAALRQSEKQQGEMLTQSRAMQEQLRQLSRQVLQAQEEERKRISRELHDVIAQTLTGINIRLGTLKQAAGLNVKDFGRNITRTQHLVEKSVHIVHRFARELRPAVLDDLGLIPALHAYLKGFMTDTGIRVSLKAFAGVEQADPMLRTVLYRVAQEALTNVERHAHASRVTVSIAQLPQCLCMKITDDGKAFDVERALQGGKRLGLLGMRERLEMVGGSFSLTSTPGKGTTVEARLPLRQTRAKPPAKRAKRKS